MTQQVRDVFTSFQIWSYGLRGRKPTFADLRAAAAANLRLLTDAQLRAGTGLRREVAKTKLEKAFRKAEAKHPLMVHDERLLSYLANRFVWCPAFTDEDLLRDFLYVLTRNDIISNQEHDRAAGLKRILALHAITRMHGTGIAIKDGSVATLHAGFANKGRVLEVKVDLGYTDWIKPVQAPVCMFLTSLTPEGSCDPALIGESDATMWNAWSWPLELSQDGTLVRLT